MREQTRAMKKRWPAFRAHRLHRPTQSVVWRGPLCGLEQKFLVEVEYGLPGVGRGEPFRRLPLVRVLCPALVPNHKALEEAPLPHVYPDPSDLRRSPLCLFDPYGNEWTHSMLIAETTVPWAREWLAHYEVWRATGRWYGGGIHSGPKEAKDVS